MSTFFGFVKILAILVKRGYLVYVSKRQYQ
jgi:hypothetical protein